MMTTLWSALGENSSVVLESPGLSLTGKELLEHIKNRAAKLHSCGFAPKQRIGFVFRRNSQSIIEFLALMYLGCIPFPLNPYFTLARLKQLIEDLQFAAFFSDPATIHILAQTAKGYEIGGKDIENFLLSKADYKLLDTIEHKAAIGILTSGSTGMPKVVMHAGESIIKNASLHAQAIALAAEDRVAMTMPCYFSFGIVANLLGTLLNRSCLVVFESSDVGAIVRTNWLQENKIQVLNTTPAMLADLCSARADFLKIVTVGGDQVSFDLAKKALKNWPRAKFYATYGLSEAGPRVATWQFDAASLNKSGQTLLGKPLAGVELRISGSKDEGELIVKTPTAMLGYFLNPIETLKVLNTETKEIKTGDIVRKDLDGNYLLIGRSKRIICRGGEKIHPGEIERSLQKIPHIKDAFVSPMPDERLGQVPEAFIIADAILTAESIRRSLRSFLPSTQLPVKFHFVDKLPQEAMRK